ncbi:TetR/AcrR family transcriptional regulator [Herbiconiux moechotypicola]|uniref:TetR/AcrR family transcriptional regulator n=1 Tax=Herbiconiux moechotypicola TaxID=637393 RepID=A0ABP5QKI9_9MICO|nr:TetR/AcrR family transcriptional regulator [Herbiconiux moechotypicola]MCS5730155.1 TetR/AcrR family transcriptional regulator [Herbiconiux moechotypicola]
MPNVTATDPRQIRSRALILDAAVGHFLEHGYLGGNVDALASEAGVAKRTVYNLFESKAVLFRAAIEHATETAEAFIAEWVDRPDGEVSATALDDEFTTFALAHARAVLQPRVLATRRLLIGEVARFPELAADYYERVPARVMRALAQRLGRYASSGMLRVDDPEAAAQHFSYLVLGATLDQALFAPGILDDTDLIASRARSGARAFLALSAPH